MTTLEPSPPSAPRAPHRLAWVLACATFPLIWMGGMVTTYGAGMAVPDWPNTYGYNLFLYPLSSWLAVWDVFLEHTHRLLGAAVGAITIALAVLLWLYDRRRWMRALGIVAVGAVCFQGTLGGLRVIEDEILLAKVHGCTAPLFFALCAALVTFTSPRWQQEAVAGSYPRSRRLAWFAMAATAGVYLQIVLGAQLRHLSPSAGLGWFVLWTWLHLIVAGGVLAAVTWLAIVILRSAGTASILARRAQMLWWLLVVQALLGCATWLTNYGWPAWFSDYFWDFNHTVTAEGRLQVLATTAHAGFGSLCLVAALSLTLWLIRLSSEAQDRPTPGAGEGGRGNRAAS